MLVTSKWYLRVKDNPSARYTLRRLIAKYPTSVAAQTGMEIMESRGWSYATDRDHGTGPSGFESGDPAAQEAAAVDPNLPPIPPAEAVPAAPAIPDAPPTPRGSR
jgi:hypothetical protein